MTLRSKVVAVLAISILAMPMTSLAACLLHRPIAGHKATHCQMVNRIGSGVTASMQSKLACCELRSEQTVPISTEQESNRFSDTNIAAINDLDLGFPTFHSKQGTDAESAQASGRKLQSLLCILLI